MLEFAVDMLRWIDNDNSFLNVFFRDELRVPMPSMVNRYKCRTWGSETPHVGLKYECYSPKLTVSSALSCHMEIGHFFFQEQWLTVLITWISFNYLQTSN